MCYKTNFSLNFIPKSINASLIVKWTKMLSFSYIFFYLSGIKSRMLEFHMEELSKRSTVYFNQRIFKCTNGSLNVVGASQLSVLHSCWIICNDDICVFLLRIHFLSSLYIYIFYLFLFLYSTFLFCRFQSWEWIHLLVVFALFSQVFFTNLNK